MILDATIPRLWPGEECFIIGGGPSLRQQHIDRLRGRNVIAVNMAFRLAPWAPVLFYGDCLFARLVPKAEIEAFGGMVFACCEQVCNHAANVRVVKRRRALGPMSADPAWLRFNYSSGACAVNLALLMGARKITLLGFDMRAVDGRHYGHSHYPAPADGFDPYKLFLSQWPQMADEMRAMGVECVNATPGSAISCIPIVDPEDVLPGCEAEFAVETSR